MRRFSTTILLLLATGAVSAAPAATTDGVRALLIPARETTLVSQMVGTLDRIPVRLGTRFKQGETLITLQCDEQWARVRMAEAEHRATLETYESKRRLQGLQSAGEMEVALAAAARDKARAQLEAAKIETTRCAITAPFAGRVTKAQARPHQGVGVGSPLLDIVSSEPPRLRLNAPSAWLPWLAPGKTFQVTVDETGKTYTARVTELNARVDAVSQTIEIEGVFTGGPRELLPGMSGLARFPAAAPPPAAPAPAAPASSPSSPVVPAAPASSSP